MVEFKKQIPNICTLLNLSFAFFSILYVFQEDFYLASIMILISAFFDAFDGILAKKLNAVSKLGKELDSLSDFVSFGLAPAIILINLSGFSTFVIVASLIFILSSELRLARYNVSVNSTGFEGLPTTFSGILLSILILLNFKFDFLTNLIISLLLLILAFLQLSKFKVKRVL